MSIEERWVAEKNDWKSIEEYVLFLKQKKAYQFVSEFCKDKDILDFGCGSGYGANFLATLAKKVMGVDISQEVIDYCSDTHHHPTLSFQKIEANFSLPFADNSFDVVVSFQVIEHVSSVKKYLMELKRVVKANGLIVITTPNKRHRLLPFQKPWNTEHLREYNLKNLKIVLESIFSEVDFKGIYGTQEVNQIEFNRVKQNPLRVYLLNPLKKLASHILPSSIIKYLKQEKNQISTHNSGVNSISKYGINDFSVGKDIRHCLDFLAVCRK